MVTHSYQTYHVDQLIMYINVESLYYIPKANIILYVNDTSIKIKLKKIPGLHGIANLT